MREIAMDNTSKICPRCFTERPLSDFYKRIDRRGQLYTIKPCRTCLNAAHRLWASRNREKAREHNRRNRIQYMAKPENREKEKIRTRLSHRQLRLQFIRAYGDRCACCGLDDERFLTLDHVAGDGAKSRKVYGRWHYGIYSALRRAGWPQQREYQVLCFNCNCAKSTRDLCPHQEDRALQVPA